MKISLIRKRVARSHAFSVFLDFVTSRAFNVFLDCAIVVLLVLLMIRYR